MAKRIQIELDEKASKIIENLKPRTQKLFISLAIEEFSLNEKSKVFFKNEDEVLTSSSSKKSEVKNIQQQKQNKPKIQEW